MGLRGAALALLICACSFEERSAIDARVADTSPQPDDMAGPPVCADELEPNNTEESASSVEFGAGAFVADNLVLCPADDLDVFAVPLVAQTQAIQARVEIQTGDGGSIVFVLLDGAGATVGVGETNDGVAYELCAGNLPGGTYFVQLSKASNVTYRLTVFPPGATFCQ